MTIEQFLVYFVFGSVTLYATLKALRDKDKGKTDTFKAVPLIGGLTLVDYWKPKNKAEQNILIGKIVVYLYVCLAFMMPSVTWVILILALMPVLYHLDWVRDYGSE